MSSWSADNPLILFDGVCNLCNATVQFVIKFDRQKRFRFASLQSRTGSRLAADSGDVSLNSVLLIHNGQVYRQSDAALRILKLLGGWWSFAFVFIILPVSFRNFVYDFIGKRRYRWFGKKEECWVPDESLKRRFIDSHENTIDNSNEQ